MIFIIYSVFSTRITLKKLGRYKIVCTDEQNVPVTWRRRACCGWVGCNAESNIGAVTVHSRCRIWRIMIDFAEKCLEEMFFKSGRGFSRC